MKFSVLIPTRNRLELLKYAVETVLRQDYEDWEVIVSDNDSAEDIQGYVAGLRDPRVRYVRTGGFVPVTDNWNFALSHSIGDYVVMLGDDDCLLKGYFRAQSELIDRYAHPDFVYTDAIQYAYPDAMPDHPQGFLQIGHTGFFNGGRAEPFILPHDDALRAVRESMAFKVTFGYNMQHFVISRRMIASLAYAGPFFQSPYPDYYASNVLFLKAQRPLIVPKPMVAIGISKKSFGYYYFNRKEAEGNRFLNNELSPQARDRLRKVLLPGSAMNTSWLVAMETIKENFRRDVPFPVDHRRYRLLQFLSVCRNEGLLKALALTGRLSLREKLVIVGLAARLSLSYLLPPRLRRAVYEHIAEKVGAYPKFDHRRKSVPYQNILEVFEHVAPDYYTVP